MRRWRRWRGELLEEAADEAAVERGGWRSHVFCSSVASQWRHVPGPVQEFRILQAVQKSSLM
jgi:hypothetical protein